MTIKLAMAMAMTMTVTMALKSRINFGAGCSKPDWANPGFSNSCSQLLGKQTALPVIYMKTNPDFSFNTKYDAAHVLVENRSHIWKQILRKSRFKLNRNRNRTWRRNNPEGRLDSSASLHTNAHNGSPCSKCLQDSFSWSSLVGAASRALLEWQFTSVGSAPWARRREQTSTLRTKKELESSTAWVYQATVSWPTVACFTSKLNTK